MRGTAAAALRGDRASRPAVRRASAQPRGEGGVQCLLPEARARLLAVLTAPARRRTRRPRWRSRSSCAAAHRAGARTRRRALVLPEADGPREGSSSTAGLAAATFGRRRFVGRRRRRRASGSGRRRPSVAHAPSSHGRCGIEWALLRPNGPDDARACTRLCSPFQLFGADVAVVITGVNDVVDQVTTRPAPCDIAPRSPTGCSPAAGAHHVVFAPLPPMHRFPLLPAPLRHVIGADARRHDRRSPAGRQRRRLARRLHDRAACADDGERRLSPGEPVYRVCGEALAAHVAQLALAGLVVHSAPAK